MSGVEGELMILGKLALTFGLLLGLPVLSLWKVRRLLRARAHSDGPTAP